MEEKLGEPRSGHGWTIRLENQLRILWILQRSCRAMNRMFVQHKEGANGSHPTSPNAMQSTTKIGNRAVQQCKALMDALDFNANLANEGISDHCPVKVGTVDIQRRSRAAFKYCNVWATHPNFPNIVETA
ncbi:hypothetical protein HAX54_046112 [Datura stramonium]|uniref:Uncharacterized protein n=1 Tax=Datura stramonium TaxID=4076 RepID=A0ABS8WKE4_DATST|nr:hypothetical protein [Datura stramonium]